MADTLLPRKLQLLIAYVGRHPGTRIDEVARVMSTTADTYRVVACGLAFENPVSSTPIIVTSAVRAGSSISGVPYTSSADCTACQPTEISPATAEIARPCSPTWRVAHNPARRVNR